MAWRSDLVGRTFEYLRTNHPAPVENPWLQTFCVRGSYFYRASWEEQFPYVSNGRPQFHIFVANYDGVRQDLVCSARLEAVNVNPALPAAIQGVFVAVAPGRHPGEARVDTRDIGRVIVNAPPLFDPRVNNALLPNQVWNDIVRRFLTQQIVQTVLNVP